MDTVNNSEQVDFETLRMLSMYADGVPVAEIAVQCGWSSPNTVYKRLKAVPENYKAAKKALAEKRNSKYRRAGALSIDLQLKYLEEFDGHDRDKLEKEIRNIISINEAAERRADLNEGKPTERVASSGEELSPEDWNKLWQRVGNAGNGLDTESIKT